MITIGVVDDHPLFREGVTRSLSEISDFKVVGNGGSSFDAMTIASGWHPDVILLDVSMPGDGLTAIDEVLSSSPRTKVIMLTASEELDTLTAAIQRGASGYVLKGVGSKGLADAIHAVIGGARFITPSMSAKVLESTLCIADADSDALTQRERDVLDLVALGLSNKHIGLRLDLQEKTVKHHMTQIMMKLRVSNRTEAALAWRDRR